MIIEYVRYRVPAERSQDFERQVAEHLAGADTCVDYALARDGDSYLLHVTWTEPGDPPAPELAGERSRYTPTGARGHGGSVPTIYEWAGGTAAFERLTEVFYDMVLRDDLIGPLFAHMDPDHPRYVAMWLAEVFGGPARYTGERGGYAHMLAHHLGRHISEAQRRRWVSLLQDAAEEVGLPDDPEFRAAFLGYIEWGTRLAVANSQPGVEPIRDAPVPRWGWGVAPPYLG
ncbi:group II truncated hemoglobin [Spongiactinospora sp. TRM90649]|uniref:group II truncated hemoglobin n=1 Tax=Spongiactinospora sp. TRM90649 TaxID=3031114 RepID=UPI0023F92EBC|nr:group II truncated hemoglobin [Spongiactinospora sp. TRM90649]MDF5755620.1 group II truncated hemoglobin [Spongiactinospora sp. TRM90649]